MRLTVLAVKLPHISYPKYEDIVPKSRQCRVGARYPLYSNLCKNVCLVRHMILAGEQNALVYKLSRSIIKDTRRYW